MNQISSIRELNTDEVLHHQLPDKPFFTTVYQAERIEPPLPIMFEQYLNHDFMKFDCLVAQKNHGSITGDFRAIGINTFHNTYIWKNGFILNESRKVIVQYDIYDGHAVNILKHDITDNPNEITTKQLTDFFIHKTEAHTKLPSTNNYMFFARSFHRVYGHWILDILPSLWMFKKESTRFKNVKYLLYSNTPKWALEFLYDFFLIKPEELIFIEENEFTAIVTLIVPSYLRTGTHISPKLNHFVEEMITLAKYMNPEVFLADKIYIRKKDDRRRVLINELEVESVFKDNGFYIFDPEELSWSSQILLFNNASIIAGNFGSALHNTLFSKNTSKTLCLAHSSINWLQSSIAGLRNSRIQYFFPCVEKSIERPSPHVPFLEYSYDIDELRSCVLDIVKLE